MSFSFDIYGKRSLENRFVFYLTVLVLMMMTFCGSIVTSESYRFFADDAEMRARTIADRVAAMPRVGGAPGAAGPPFAAPLSAVVLDPQIVVVAEWLPGRGAVVLVGESLDAYRLPETIPTAPFDVQPRAPTGRSCWGFVEVRGERTLLVLVDSAMPLSHLRMMVGTLCWITALALVVHAFLARVMARAVLRPIRQFIDALGQVTQGRFAFALTVAEQDEVGQLKATFNYMQKQLAEKENTERQLAFHQHMSTVGQLAAGVAHEIRNPLASISSLTQLIAGDAQQPPKTQEYARVILREIQRMDASIQQLLNFARPLKAEFAPGLLSKVMDHVVRLMEVDAKNRGAALRIDNHWPGETTMLVDAGKLEQLLINLVKNGIEALGERGTITLALGFDEGTDHAILTVEDDGPGMAEALKDGAFDTWVTTKGGGSGLGLAIVQRLVAMHNGQITVDTELNRGTRFTVRLPRLTPEMVARL